jgi:hypothetical protein
MTMGEKSKRETDQLVGPSMLPSMAYVPLKPLFANNLTTIREIPFNLFLIDKRYNELRLKNN